MKKILIVFSVVMATVIISLTSYFISQRYLEKDTFLANFDVSYIKESDLEFIISRSYETLVNNKKIIIKDEEKSYSPNAEIFSLNMNNTVSSFVEKSRNKVFIDLDREKFIKEIESEFDIEQEAYDISLLINDIKLFFVTAVPTSVFELNDYQKKGNVTIEMPKVASVRLTFDDANKVMDEVSNNLIIKKNSRFSLLSSIKDANKLSAKDYSTIASGISYFSTYFDASNFIKTSPYVRLYEVDMTIRPYYAYVSEASGAYFSFYNNENFDIFVKLTQLDNYDIKFDLFVDEEIEGRYKPEFNQRSVRFEEVYPDNYLDYKSRESGIIYDVFRIDTERNERVKLFSTYYLPYGEKKNG